MKYRYSFLLFLAFLFLSFLFAAVGDLAQKGTRKGQGWPWCWPRCWVGVAATGAGLFAVAWLPGLCALVAAWFPPGPRRFVLSANGKRPRRRSPGATLPALVWAAAFPLALGCAVPLWRGPDLGRGWRRCLLCVAHVRRPRLQSIKMIELRHATICPPIAAPYKNLRPRHCLRVPDQARAREDARTRGNPGNGL